MAGRQLRQIVCTASIMGLVALAALAIGGCNAERPHRGATAAGGIEPLGGGVLLADEQVQIVLKREKAAAYNLNPADVEAAVINYIDLNRGSLTRQGLLAAQVGSFQGKPVLLSDVAELRTLPAVAPQPVAPTP